MKGYPPRKPIQLKTIKASFVLRCLAKDLTENIKQAWDLACQGE